jgi:hypothetical protein
MLTAFKRDDWKTQLGPWNFREKNLTSYKDASTSADSLLGGKNDSELGQSCCI